MARLVFLAVALAGWARGDEALKTEFAEIVAEIGQMSGEGLRREDILKGCVDGLFTTSPVKAPHLKPPRENRTQEEWEGEFWKAAEGLSTYPGQRLELPGLVRGAVNAYLRGVDQYGGYESPEVFGAYLSESKGKAGIGMTVQLREGVMICFPYPGLAADAAGVKTGDELQMVDGEDVKGTSLLKLVSLVGGPEGSEVELAVKRTSGRTSRVTVKRELLKVPEVVVESQLGGYQIRIRKFTQSAVAELEAAFQKAGSSRMVTVDLRGNGGGEVEAAVAIAGFFLPKGTVVGYLSERGEKRPLETTREPVLKPVSITILQDGGTASAAEMFLAAMISRSRAQVVNRGEKTFGKGVFQLGRRLRSGGYLTVTHGHLLGPGGETWDKTGIPENWQPAAVPAAPDPATKEGPGGGGGPAGPPALTPGGVTRPPGN